MNRDVIIIGDYKNDLIALPLEINQPIIELCSCDYLDIYSTITNNKRKGLCIINEKNIFQIEENIFKVSLYGTIHRGWYIERVNKDNNHNNHNNNNNNINSFEYKRNNEEFQIVVKKFRKNDVRNLSRADDPLQEFAALQEIGNNHPNVLGQIACLQDEEFYYSIMRFCEGGELCSQILGVGPIPENHARFLFLQLVDAIEYIQSKGIFHRDISLENILITSSNNNNNNNNNNNGNTNNQQQQQQLILIDFGMCLKVSKNPENQNQPYLLPPMPAKGKKSYMAPEIVAESHPFNGFQSDVWSLGIVLFTMLTGKFIVTHASPLCQLFRHVRNGRLKEMCQHWRLGLSDNVQNLLFDMLSVDPKKRPTISEIRKYSWCVHDNNINVSAPGA